MPMFATSGDFLLLSDVGNNQTSVLISTVQVQILPASVFGIQHQAKRKLQLNFQHQCLL
jgi:hypothetical protein